MSKSGGSQNQHWGDDIQSECGPRSGYSRGDLGLRGTLRSQDPYTARAGRAWH